MSDFCLSVVVPTRDRHQPLLRTIESLRQQSFQAEAYELVIVDDGSAVPVHLPLREAPPATTLVRLEGVGRSAARNAGARTAHGSILVFVDDDVTVEPGFLAAHAEAQRRWPGSLVTGQLLLPEDCRGRPFGRFRHQLEQASLPRQAGPTGLSNLCTAANMSVPSNTFSAMNGFDEALASSEDQDLALRHTAAGGRIVFWPEACGIHHDSALDIGRYCRRVEWGSQHQVRFVRKHGTWPDNIRRQRSNGPVRLFREPPALSLTKLAKMFLALRPLATLLLAATNATERVAPRSRFLFWLYRAAIGVFIFRGHRRGLEP